MFAGFRKEDLIPIPEIAVPQQYAVVGIAEGATPKDKAVGDLALIMFFYLLHVGEYTQIVVRPKLVHFNSGCVTWHPSVEIRSYPELLRKRN